MTANPAIACGRIPIDRVLSDILTQPEHEVRRYTLNQFISGTAASWLPGELFKAATGQGISNMQGVVFAVDVARNWEYATIAAANSNGDIQESGIAGRANRATALQRIDPPLHAALTSSNRHG
jgi:hypothetical protein